MASEEAGRPGRAEWLLAVSGERRVTGTSQLGCGRPCLSLGIWEGLSSAWKF